MKKTSGVFILLLLMKNHDVCRRDNNLDLQLGDDDRLLLHLQLVHSLLFISLFILHNFSLLLTVSNCFLIHSNRWEMMDFD